MRESPPSSHSQNRKDQLISEGLRSYLIYPPPGIAQGPLLPPPTRRTIMGNANAAPQAPTSRPQQPRSNLSVLLEHQQDNRESSRAAVVESTVAHESVAEADCASEPRVPVMHSNSAPSTVGREGVPPPDFVPVSRNHSMDHPRARRVSTGDVPSVHGPSTGPAPPAGSTTTDESVRRSISSKELGVFAPGTIGSSPHTFMLHQKEILNATMQQRLMDLRKSLQSAPGSSLSASPTGTLADTSSEGESHGSHRERHPTAKEKRNRRRAEHTNAVISDLCQVVTDLFIAESKLLSPSAYGVNSSVQRDEVLHSVEQFVSALPPRYALSEDAPSEVLVHMRLMAAVRSDPSRAVVHCANIDDDTLSTNSFHRRPNRFLHLVTISCADVNGLLEYITKLLSTGGSRVLDADVMMTTDGIVLDRFVVEMNGRLRLDKLVNCIESFLASAEETRQKEEAASSDRDASEDGKSAVAQKSPTSSPGHEASGPIYVFPPTHRPETSPKRIQEEIETAVPLSRVLQSQGNLGTLGEPGHARKGSLPSLLRREHSMPSPPLQPVLSSPDRCQPKRSSYKGQQSPLLPTLSRKSTGSVGSSGASSLRQRRPLVNREATNFSMSGIDGALGADYVVPLNPPASLEDPVIPLIPFEELMLIETLGMGRVSTIYRAAWQRSASVEMVALKVATVDPETGDTSHVDELRREADIAAMLQHTSVCQLTGIAADAECFCLAYEFCEGGSLLSLLSDTTRYYEYLPIALDIANGMAYLHSRDVIHRDLKPSNILLTADHRAKIADFGMSVANTGQELTAETGTYRFMAPEVIRHESYSSNADVYSFGIVLWQLVTREIPFATMTPIQAAFAVAEGRRPEIPPSTPPRLQEIISACWDQDSQKRPSFTYIAMALADYARMAFSPANVGAQTLQIANDMPATVEGNSTVNVDFSTPVLGRSNSAGDVRRSWIMHHQFSGSYSSNVGLEI